MTNAFEHSGPNYQIDPKREELRQKRLALLHASDDDRAENTGFIKFRPVVDGRLVREEKK